MRKEKAIHYIYKTTCNVTKRYYVGMHSTNNLDDDYMGSGKRLRYSIRKYGKDNHTKEILEFLNSRELLIEAEVNAITEDMIDDKNCMNLKGGEGGYISEEHYNRLKKIASKYQIERWKDPEYREKGKKQLLVNVKKSHRNGNNKSGKENYDWSGKKHSEESKKKMSKSSKGQGAGNDNSQFGKCWITNEIESKKIYRGDTIPEGWRLGRKMKK